MYKLAFTLPGLPRTTNSNARQGWRSQFAHSRKWKRAVVETIDFPKKPQKPLLKAKLKLVRYSSKEPDFDGLVSSFKHVIDGLIEAQVISGDSMSIIGQPEYRWEQVSRNKGYVSVEIQELA